MSQSYPIDVSRFEEHLENYLLCPLGPDAVTVDIELRPEVVERVQALVSRRGITTDAFFNAIADCILDSDDSSNTSPSRSDAPA